jgi:AraC-like DNA-binding protein
MTDPLAPERHAPSLESATDTPGSHRDGFEAIRHGLVVGPVWSSERHPPRRRERVVPNVTAQLVFDLDTGAGVLVGLRTAAAVVDPPLRARGVRLTGAGAYSILGPDAAATVDHAVDVDAIASPSELRRLRDAGITVAGLTQFVTSSCRRFVPDIRAVRAEQSLRSGATSAEVLRDANMDRRRFVPLFRSHIGINPSTYQRLVRFAATITALRISDDCSIAHVATSRGYADQAHLTREIRALTAITPGDLKRLPAGPVNHLPVDAPTR